NLFAEHEFRIGIVQALFKFEIGVDSWFVNRPAGEAARYFGDVFLRVAAVDTERVQLHQLAPVVFVQAAFILFLGLLWIHRRARRPRTAKSATAHPLAHGTFDSHSLGRSRIRT